ncbi:hypothetical protein HK096_004433 [Nowakowskiella sp. JEL0078]|nr:hypothetical protein HK096_004433 [Nowakowskiella sp. JEL0078]
MTILISFSLNSEHLLSTITALIWLNVAELALLCKEWLKLKRLLAMFAGIVVGFNLLSLDSQTVTKLKNVLLANNAEIDTLISSNILGFSHIISTDIDFPLYKSACKSKIVIVTPQWVFSSVTQNELLRPEFFSPFREMIFSELVVATSPEISQTDTEEIFAYVSYFGGDFRFEFDDSVTHLISTTMSNDVSDQAMSANIPIVIPEWVQDCVSLQLLLPISLYRFPDPPIRYPDPVILPEPSQFLRNPYFFENHVLYISPECDFDPVDLLKQPSTASPMLSVEGENDRNNRLKNQIVRRVQEAQGVVVDKFDPEMCTCVVLNSRLGSVYIEAENLGIWVASAKWLLETLDTGVVRSPKSRILHYPRPAYSIEGFQDMKISVTNYTGKARSDIADMVLYCGAKFKRSLTSDDTHLICAKTIGEKYARSNEWPVHLVNHIWIEQCLAAHSHLPEARLHFLNFSPVLGTIVGHRSVSKSLVEKSVQYAKDSIQRQSSASNIEIIIPTIIKQPKRRSGSPEMGDAELQIRKRPLELVDDDEERMETTPTRFATKRAVRPQLLKRQKVAETFVDEEPNSNDMLQNRSNSNRKIIAPNSITPKPDFKTVSSEIPATANTSKPRLTKRSSTQLPRVVEIEESELKPLNRKQIHHDVEISASNKPLPLPQMLPSQHKSAQIISQEKQLNGKKTQRSEPPILRDLSLLPFDEKTVIPPINMLKTSVQAPTPQQAPYTRASTSRNPPPSQQLLNTITTKQQPPKKELTKIFEPIATRSKSRNSENNETSKRPVICMTGVRLTPKESEKVIQLGATLTSDPLLASHMVASKIMRTEKMLIAINRGVIIVTKAWLLRCFEASRFVSERGYLLTDKEAELKYSFTLSRSLTHSRATPLFKIKNTFVTLYVTPLVHPEYGILKRIVESGGGAIKIVKSERDLPPAQDFIDGKAIAVSCVEDSKLHEFFTSRGANIFNVEKLLTGVLKQEMALEDDENLIAKGKRGLSQIIDVKEEITDPDVRRTRSTKKK